MGTNSTKKGELVELVLHARGSYEPFAPRLNGFSGQYGSVNIRQGSHADLNVSVRDHLSQKVITLPEAALTFFNIAGDQGRFARSVEKITAGGFHRRVVAVKSEVHIANASAGRTMFRANASDMSGESPQDPRYLTVRQRSRAVSLLFSDFREQTITITAERGGPARFLNFLPTPTLLCAKTVREGFRPPSLVPRSSSDPPGRLSALHRGANRVPVNVERSSTLVLWEVEEGDSVVEGDIIAIIKVGDAIQQVLSPAPGKVLERQPLKPGEVLDQRVAGETIALIGVSSSWSLERKGVFRSMWGDQLKHLVRFIGLSCLLAAAVIGFSLLFWYWIQPSSYTPMYHSPRPIVNDMTRSLCAVVTPSSP